MDALSEVLNAVRLTGALFINGEFGAPWGLQATGVERLVPLLPPGTERLLVYHLVTDGEATVCTDAGADATLTAGDIVILPYGDAHVFSNGSPPSLIDGTTGLLGCFGSGELLPIRGGGSGPSTRFICGYFGCEHRADRLFLAGLPSVIKVNVRGDAGGQWLESSLRHLVREASSERPGQRALMSKLAEALFIEALRRYAEGLPGEQTGWLAAARDPAVGHALALLHRDPRHPWSLAELASRAGASRTVLGERFVQLLGESPLAYLARWRLQLAARQLQTTRKTLTQVADAVGYESDAAFSRAFRREFGVPPGRWRRSTGEQTHSPR